MLHESCFFSASPVLVLLDIRVYKGSRILYFIYVAVPGRNRLLRISTTLPRSKRYRIMCVHVHNHVCSSFMSRLFLIEGGNEAGDEAVCTSYRLFL